MKRIISAVASGGLVIGSVIAFGAAGASAGTTTTTTGPTTTTTAPTTTTTLAPPVQGSAPLPLALSVDTVVGSGGSGVLKATVGCAQTNEFLIGQTVVFRLSGQNVLTGGTPLTPANVASVNVIIPGVATPLAMNYGNHGTSAFWSAGWSTAGYPTTGIVNFKIEVTSIAAPAKTKVVAYRAKAGSKWVLRHKRVIVTPAVKGATVTWSQTGFSPSSNLTLNPVPVA